MFALSADGGGGGAAWPSETNSVTAPQGPARQISNSASDRTTVEQLPTVEEVMANVVNEFPHLVGLPLSERDGQKLRGEVVEEEGEEERVNPEWEYDSGFTEWRVERREAVDWGQAVRRFLEWYEEYRYKVLKFGRGEPHEVLRETFRLEARNSWQPEYNTKQFAELKALERQALGYDTCAECATYFCRRPADHETAHHPGRFEQPVVVLLTRTASATPDGDHVPPVEHDREVAEAWQPAYHVMRNQLKAAGYDSSEYLYHKQAEPHPGQGANRAYGHEHVALLIDVAGHGHDAEDIEALLRPVIDKHVEVCDWAEHEAHGAEAIEVKEAGEFDESIASYVAKYLSIDDGADLFERPPEYIMWAASQWSTNTQKATRSDNAGWAISADLCEQDYHNPEQGQVLRHGEEIRRSTKRGVSFECAECGSPWDVDQDHDTLASARLATDGGEVVDAEPPAVAQRTIEAAAVAGPERVDAQLVDDVLGSDSTDAEEIWQDARSGASVGESTKRSEWRRRIEEHLRHNPGASVAEVAGALELPPVADEIVREVKDGGDNSELSGFEREPSWRLESVVNRRWRECYSCKNEYLSQHGEECPRCGSEATKIQETDVSPGQIDMRPLKLPEQRQERRRKAIIEAMPAEYERGLYSCKCGVTMGSDLMLQHVEAEHGEGAEPGQLADMVRRASAARGGVGGETDA